MGALPTDGQAKRMPLPPTSACFDQAENVVAHSAAQLVAHRMTLLHERDRATHVLRAHVGDAGVAAHACVLGDGKSLSRADAKHTGER